MKARAWLLLILISFMSFTGFSTTTDLSQNSDPVVHYDQNIDQNLQTDFVVNQEVDFINRLESRAKSNRIQFNQIYHQEISELIISNSKASLIDRKI